MTAVRANERRNIMFIDLTDSERLAKGKLEDYRREAEAYRLVKGLKDQGKGSSTNLKLGLALIAVISVLAVASQFAIA
jgi:hypothetical protein